jgi:hypothetical protein
LGGGSRWKEKSATVTDRRYSKRMKTRCEWCLSDPLYIRYHDEEWGVPLHDERRLFEMLILEGAQAGLSWLTILKRRDGYRKAFDRDHAPDCYSFSLPTLSATWLALAWSCLSSSGSA